MGYLSNILKEKIYDEPDETIQEGEGDNDEEWSFNLFKYLKDMFSKTKPEEKYNNENNSTKKYLNREQAIEIASREKNLRKSMYNEAKDKGYCYGIIELNDFYATLVKYNNRYAWYIKVIDGNYGLKEGRIYKKGCFNEYSNIRCLVMADDGNYIYLDENFDTRAIRMVLDDEFLFYINNVKH